MTVFMYVVYVRSSHNYRVVKITSPNINYFIIVGAYCHYISIYVRVLPSTDYTFTFVRCFVSISSSGFCRPTPLLQASLVSGCLLIVSSLPPCICLAIVSMHHVQCLGHMLVSGMHCYRIHAPCTMSRTCWLVACIAIVPPRVHALYSGGCSRVARSTMYISRTYAL